MTKELWYSLGIKEQMSNIHRMNENLVAADMPIIKYRGRREELKRK